MDHSVPLCSRKSIVYTVKLLCTVVFEFVAIKILLLVVVNNYEHLANDWLDIVHRMIKRSRRQSALAIV